MKVGDKIVCIKPMFDRLTIGKSYTIVVTNVSHDYLDMISVIDDTNYQTSFYLKDDINSNRFMLLEEYRSKKLTELGI